ncbi:hypothetical protein [Microvirga brassicacearum]|uniref:Uncharacterized protein n=1 Tax=Microvirga brassicacearum TaxID=2580413 RepID=A0A5N3P5I5_9HYPH|nr:hypothetical protein [Microvirga brassicacearum]KAB0264998.1 hypothetical protein FEZ63_20530 [Microvirga brassicacearum]
MTGLPVHFSVYYLGYVAGLWLWRRRSAAVAFRSVQPSSSLAAEAVLALVTAAGVVIVLGLIQALVLQEFPGITWFVVRLAVAFPFTLAWWMVAGTDRTAAVGGGIMMGFLLTTYSHYLAPVGLPNDPVRLLAEDPPPAVVHWLSYREEFLVILPITLIVASLAYLAAGRWRRRHQQQPTNPLGRAGIGSVLAGTLALAALGAVAALYTGPEANQATVSSTGSGNLEKGTPFEGEAITTTATLRMSVENRNTHRTPLPPHDRVDIDATVNSPDGTVYEIRAVEPMVTDPQGRFTTWSGIGYDVWHHGRSGIGSSRLPPIQSNVAVFALGNISANGRIVAAGIPVHVMTTSRDGARLELHVGDTDFPLAGVPEGHLRVMWSDYVGGHTRSGVYARYSFGGGFLLVILGFAVAAARRQARGTFLLQD